MRICSLSPSGTEILCALGLVEQLVGVSHRCDHPPEVVGKPIVSQLLVRRDAASSAAIDGAVSARQTAGHPVYALDADLVRSLQPDLIVTQEVCEVCAVPASLAEEVAKGLVREPRLVSVTASTLDDILGNIQRLGTVTGRRAEAEALVGQLRRRIAAVAEATAAASARPRVAFLEWLDPLWVAGNWTPELIALAGGVDGLGRPGQRSRKVTWPELAADAPDVLLIAPCGFTIERTLAELPRFLARPEWAELPAVRRGQVYVLDGQLYSRYGPRIVDGLEALARLLHPGLWPGPWPARLAQRVSVA